MFQNEITINEFQLWQFENITADLDEEKLYVRAAGHGHPPVWVLGHLAIVGELGQQLLGGTMTHSEWVALFGPGSSDAIEESVGLTKTTLCDAVTEGYRGLQKLTATADADTLAQPHGVGLLENTPIQTVGQLISLLLTNHFGFHLAQLSSCRRDAGHGPLF